MSAIFLLKNHFWQFFFEKKKKIICLDDISLAADVYIQVICM